jgi:hypothetical protein
VDATASAAVWLQTTLNGLTATIAELNYVDGVTSNIQTQLGTKLPLAGGTMTGTIADFTSTGIDDNATSTAITIDASENVGIGRTSPSHKLDVLGDVRISSVINDATNKTSRIKFGHYTNAEEPVTGMFCNSFATTSTLNIGGGSSVENAQTDINLRTAANNTTVGGTPRLSINSTGNVTVNTGNLVIGTSGKGIDFSADGNAAGMTSEVLDDYEEGTWTASLVASTTDFSGVKNTSGKYTKIGNVVIVQFGLSITSPSGGVGNMKITGLPFPVSTNYADVTTSSLQLARFDNAGTINFYGKVVNASSEINLGYNINYTGFFTNMDASEINGNSTPWMSGTLVYHIS